MLSLNFDLVVNSLRIFEKVDVAVGFKRCTPLVEEEGVGT